MASDQLNCVVVVDPIPDRMLLLAENISRYGYVVDIARPDSWMQRVTNSNMALVAGPSMRSLDLWTFCREVRENSDIGLVALIYDATPDQVALALEGGADSCLSVDAALSARQIVAALRALERRSRITERAQPDVIEAGPLRVDLASKEVSLHNKRVMLTPTEFGILAVLAKQPGRVFSGVELLREVHGYEAETGEAQDIVKVHVSRLRQKLEENPQTPQRIVNVRGQGYIYMFERRREANVA